MKATELLMEEHRVIEQVLGCVEKMAMSAGATGRLDVQHATLAIEFFRHFADHCHHAKEENQLFTLLEQRGLMATQGPLAVMLDEHVQGRSHVAGMAEAVAAFQRGETSATQTFARHATAYAELLRAHIVKEDFVLYPLAEEVLSADDQAQLLQAFDVVEQEHHDHHERFLAVAEELGRYYEVPRPTAPDYDGLARVCPAHATPLGDY